MQPHATVSPGLPDPHFIPAVPFTPANVRAAKRTGQLPAVPAPGPAVAAPAVAAPLVAAPLVAAPPVLAPSMAAPIGPPLAIVPLHAAPAMPEIPRPVNAYPFDFWPPRPWDVEPHDASLGSTVTEIKRDDTHRRKWMDTAPHWWPVVNEDNYRGVRFLGAGSFGCAGLWCHVDDDNNIIKVSSLSVSAQYIESQRTHY